MTERPFDCERTRELLPLHVGGDLDGPDALGVRAHVEACGACRDAAGRAQDARRLFFEVAGADGALPVDLWPALSERLAAERDGAPTVARSVPELGPFAVPLTGPLTRPPSAQSASRERGEARSRRGEGPAWSEALASRRGARGWGTPPRVLGLAAAVLVLAASASLLLAVLDGPARAPSLATGNPGVWVTPVELAGADEATPAGGLRRIDEHERLEALGTVPPGALRPGALLRPSASTHQLVDDR